MLKYLILFCILMGTTALNAATQIKTSPLSQEMKNYITTQFKTVKDKKLVLYSLGATKVPGCPHSAAFSKIIKQQRNSESLRTAYSFQGFDINKMFQKSMDKASVFNELCGTFCVVSLQNNWVYAPLGHSFFKEQTAILPEALKTLKSK